jgi:predicted amidohydrolase
MQPHAGALRVALFQFDVERGLGAALERNLAQVLGALEQAAALGASLLCLPEMWPTSFLAAGGPFGSAALLAQAVGETEAAWQRAAARAAELGLALVGSGFGPTGASGLPPNRLRWIEGGRERLCYDKLHLFGPTGEPIGFERGAEPPGVVEWRDLRASGIVCYDLRFGPLIEELLESRVELLCVPAQWAAPRAPHFEALARGRAVELQAFVLAVNRTGRETLGQRGRTLEYGGGSRILGPGGQVLAALGAEPGLCWADIEPERVRELAREVPVRQDWRRVDYARWRARRGGA